MDEDLLFWGIAIAAGLGVLWLIRRSNKTAHPDSMGDSDGSHLYDNRSSSPASTSDDSNCTTDNGGDSCSSDD
ncbi:hypothetical protein ACFSM5_10155 [Lacibacterium aquatile]|uniref:LPXTG cell wall anchor domain-containing protein n=1 Tax=Lacibacterium aquatile TaxID=1168082 RepID=A0ABW5DRY1_9PROT